MVLADIVHCIALIYLASLKKYKLLLQQKKKLSSQTYVWFGKNLNQDKLWVGFVSVIPLLHCYTCIAISTKVKLTHSPTHTHSIKKK